MRPYKIGLKALFYIPNWQSYNQNNKEQSG